MCMLCQWTLKTDCSAPPSSLSRGLISSFKETTSGDASPPAGCKTEEKDIDTGEKNRRFGDLLDLGKGNNRSLRFKTK